MTYREILETRTRKFQESQPSEEPKALSLLELKQRDCLREWRRRYEKLSGNQEAA